MAFGRSSAAPKPVRAPEELSAAARLAAIEARVDQVRQLFRQAAATHRGNRALCDVLLDADNVLHGPYPDSSRTAEGGG
jgi:hypothetical protein